MRIALALLLLALPAFAQTPAFDIREGDRVVFLGDVLLEREGTYGDIETRMVQQFPNVHFTVRNLSWSGETPLGVARASFDPPEKGWERLQEQIAEAKPTVVFLGFGMAASLQEITDRSGDLMLNRDKARYGADPMSAVRFKTELDQLASAISNLGEVRLVFLSPIWHEDQRATRPGTPDPAEHNRLISEYSSAIEEVAAAHQGRFVTLADFKAPTSNGIHLTPEGYTALGAHVALSLGWTNPAQPNAALKEAITRKNQLFFYRFRPANYTYLFGFRKHEQGKNAAEIPLFDPVVDKLEKEIARLRKPLPHLYEFKRVDR